MGRVQVKKKRFIIHCLAIMHRTTIVQNWNNKLICSCCFWTRTTDTYCRLGL